MTGGIIDFEHIERVGGLLDTVTDDYKEACLRVSTVEAGYQRTAFVQYDPESDAGASRTGRPRDYYWYEYGTDRYGRPLRRDEWLTRPEFGTLRRFEHRSHDFTPATSPMEAPLTGFGSASSG